MLEINFSPYPTFETKRLLLRKITTDDINEVFFLRSNKNVLKYLDKHPSKTKEEALTFITLIDELERSNDAINWGITLKGNNTLLGNICIWNISKEHHRGELGYALHPDFHGKGIMQEAMEAVIEYGFKKAKLHTLEANVNPNNQASIKLLERNGFVREAYYKENYFFDGKFLDTAIYSLLTPVR